MSLSEFKISLVENLPPDNLSVYLLALWFDGKGNWNKAHNVIQDVEDKKAAAIHAYLHRKEGDIGNADYWYSCSGKKRNNISLEKEWEELVDGLIIK
ncbi:MAG: hypothetical protein ABI359_04445 [Ginsengibacter sp.]